MDEIDILNKVKKYVIILLACLLLFYIWLINIFSYKDRIVYYLIFAFFILLILPGILSYIFLKLKYKNAKYIKRTLENITRELSNLYSPAICSLLYNKKIEAYSDYSATILKLENEGYIKVNNSDYTIDFLKEDISKLNNHEKYALECLKNEKSFDMKKFKNCVIEDAINLEIIEKKQREISDKKIVLFVALFIFGFSAVMVLISINLYFSLIFLVLGVVFKITNGFDTNIEDGYILTIQGKKIKKEIIGFRNFVKEYTLLKERQIEEKEIFGNYISYAIALGEEKTVEQFIKKNEQYRNLIYKNY